MVNEAKSSLGTARHGTEPRTRNLNDGERNQTRKRGKKKQRMKSRRREKEKKMLEKKHWIARHYKAIKVFRNRSKKSGKKLLYSNVLYVDGCVGATRHRFAE